MGIKEDNKGGFGSHVFYVCMQAADIFHLKVMIIKNNPFLKKKKANICQEGTDQRKANKLAREYYQIISGANGNLSVKPIILSHRILKF